MKFERKKKHRQFNTEDVKEQESSNPVMKLYIHGIR